MIRIKRLFIFSLILLLSACSKITQENYNKIQMNMTLEQVTQLIGPVTQAEQMDIAGIRGVSAIWKDTNAEIDIQFLNNKVIVKSFSDLHHINGNTLRF